MNDYYTMLFAKLNRFLECLHASFCSGWHVGIVNPHEFDFIKRQLFESFEIWLPATFFRQVIFIYGGTHELAYRGVGGITGIGNQHSVARIEKCERYVCHTLFRSYQWLDFCLGVELHSIPFFVPVGKGFAQLRNPDVGLITMIGRVSHSLGHCVNHILMRRSVRATNTQ